MANRPSPTLSLAPTPSNIIVAKPPADKIKKKLNIKPTKSPNPPKISKTAVIVPNLLNPKRMNSCFILSEVK